MTKNEIFQFIAFRLEKRGQPKGDNPTLYGINKRWHPKEYSEIETADATDNPLIIQKTVFKIYNNMFENSIAKYFESYYPLWVNIFDMLFNDGERNSTLCWQQTVNSINVKGYNIVEDGIWGNETRNSSFILKKIPTDILNEIYSYKRIQHYTSISNSSWIKGLVNRVIRLQMYIIKTNLT